jgi:hypothetical protein
MRQHNSTVENSRWWAQKIPETCRVLRQNKFWIFDASGWLFYTKRRPVTPCKCRLHVPTDRLAWLCYPLQRETSQNNAIHGRNLLAILSIAPIFLSWIFSWHFFHRNRHDCSICSLKGKRKGKSPWIEQRETFPEFIPTLLPL